MFVENTDGFERLLVLIVDTSAGGAVKSDLLSSQEQYKVLQCLWLLSYGWIVHEETGFGRVSSTGVDTCHRLCDDDRVLRYLKHVLTAEYPEKMVRMAVGTLVNLTKQEDICLKLLVHGFLPAVADQHDEIIDKHIKVEHFFSGVDDLLDDLVQVHDILTAKNAEHSTLDGYFSQVASGQLDWTPVHTHEEFWQKSSLMFVGDKGHQVVGGLLKILNDEDLSQVHEGVSHAVALHDLGQLMHYESRTRKFVEAMEGRQTISKHLDSPHPNVAKQALLCFQKLLLAHDGVPHTRGR